MARYYYVKDETKTGLYFWIDKKLKKSLKKICDSQELTYGSVLHILIKDFVANPEYYLNKKHEVKNNEH